MAEHGTALRVGTVEGGPLATARSAAAAALTPTTTRTMVETTYDYVIVGAGSAGCLLASRLAQAPEGYSVCLLEAGDAVAGDLKLACDDENNADSGGGGNAAAAMVADPMQYSAAFASSLNWGFATQAQPSLGGRHIRCTRGKGVGGCSLVNGMLYNRGSWQIYDSWSEAASLCPATATATTTAPAPASQNGGGDACGDGNGKGLIEWSAAACLPYFRLHEDNTRGASPWHGAGGEVRISDIPTAQLSPMAFAFHAAAQEAGFAANPDQNSLAPTANSQDGVQLYQCFVDDREGGRRVTASRAFLGPLLGPDATLPNSNLKLHSNCAVEAIVLRGGGVNSSNSSNVANESVHDPAITSTVAAVANAVSVVQSVQSPPTSTLPSDMSTSSEAAAPNTAPLVATGVKYVDSAGERHTMHNGPTTRVCSNTLMGHGARRALRGHCTPINVLARDRRHPFWFVLTCAFVGTFFAQRPQGWQRWQLPGMKSSCLLV